MKKIIVLFSLFFVCSSVLFAAVKEHPLYAVSKKPTPVLNTPDFRSVFGGADGISLGRDDSGLIRSLEYIALEGAHFRVVEVLGYETGLIYRVETDRYETPLGLNLYIDSRFVETMKYRKKEAARKLLSEQSIIDNLRQSLDVDIYMWGGNYKRGIPELLRYYPPRAGVTNKTKRLWTLQGLDCSGLLYEATRGYTPRNTRELIQYGDPVDIEGLSIREIVKKVEPLDLIVWRGHVIIVLDGDYIIESRYKYDHDIEGRNSGVRIRSLLSVLKEITRKRKPVNVYDEHEASRVFVVRRWYG